MKKIIAFSFAFVFSVLPLSAHAVVNSINGQTALDQFLVSPGSNATNTMHMDIITVGTDTHRFRWNGSPWRANQGGTGLLTSPLFGQLLVGDGLGGYALMATSSLGIMATPAGSDGQVQFNYGGSFGAHPAFMFDYDMTQGQAIVTLGLEGEDAHLKARDAVSANSFGANMQILAGSGGSIGGGGGALFLSGGHAMGGDENGGDITIQSGAGSGLGARGFLQLRSGNFSALLDTSLISGGDQKYIFPDLPGTFDDVATFGVLEADQTWRGDNTFSKGPDATTVVTFGELDEPSSYTCFNAKNTAGDNISFYFVGTTMVIESNVCQ